MRFFFGGGISRARIVSNIGKPSTLGRPGEVGEPQLAAEAFLDAGEAQIVVPADVRLD